MLELLTTEPIKVDKLRRQLAAKYPEWFPVNTKPDTQRRFMRNIRDQLIEDGIPVCSLNTGICLGTKELVDETIAREGRLAAGCYRRMQALQKVREML